MTIYNQQKLGTHNTYSNAKTATTTTTTTTTKSNLAHMTISTQRRPLTRQQIILVRTILYAIAGTMYYTPIGQLAIPIFKTTYSTNNLLEHIYNIQTYTQEESHLLNIVRNSFKQYLKDNSLDYNTLTENILYNYANLS